MTNEEAMEIIGKNWNTRQPTTPTTGEDDVERVARAIDPVAWEWIDKTEPEHPAMAVTLERQFRQAIAALAAISPTTEDAEKRLLEWLGGQHRLELTRYSPVYGDDDQTVEWRVMQVSGSINDREWDIVGRGDTPAQALTSARKALASIGERS